MKTIGFKNFRRFENLEPLQLSKVNFFVGGNNSGKSTVTKAMMLLMDNLTFMRPKQNGLLFENMPSFRLDANRIHDLHVGTFARALRKPYPDVKEMCFEAGFERYKFILTVTGNLDSTSADADVRKFEIVNLSDGVHYTFDFEANTFAAEFNTEVLNEYPIANEPEFWRKIRFGINRHSRNKPTQSQEKRLLEMKIAQLKADLAAQTNPIEIARINNWIKIYTGNLKKLKDSEKPVITKTKNMVYESPLIIDYGMPSSRLIVNLLDSQWMHYKDTKEGAKQVAHSNNSEEQSEQANRVALQVEEEEFYNGLYKEEKAMLCMFADDARQLRRFLSLPHIEYLSAHTASQKVLFSIEDKNDYMSQVIREFVAAKITEGTEMSKFLYDWMYKHFEIAMGYDIQPIHGEAYTMDVICMNGEKMPLADLGMGAVQIIMLLFRLATIIGSTENIAIRNTTFIVEEPEQNIHPKLQSRLADLFAYVSDKYGCQFIIETHSEYIIRRTQAMIATGEVSFEDNPFKVYYFPENGQPYDMEYQESGLFAKKFGDGFFDEASRQHLTVIKKARELQ